MNMNSLVFNSINEFFAHSNVWGWWVIRQCVERYNDEMFFCQSYLLLIHTCMLEMILATTYDEHYVSG